MKNINEESEQLFSKISHDLRGSFTSILGFSDLLNDTTEELTVSEIVDFSKRIGIQAKDSFDLLINFVIWLKLEKFNGSLAEEKISLLDVFYDVHSLHQSAFLINNNNIEYSLDEEITLKIDYEIIKTIINNIFSFLLQYCNENSCIKIFSKSSVDQLISIKILAEYNEEGTKRIEEISYKNEKPLIIDTILFSKLFIEQCNGSLNFNKESENIYCIEFNLPIS